MSFYIKVKAPLNCNVASFPGPRLSKTSVDEAVGASPAGCRHQAGS